MHVLVVSAGIQPTQANARTMRSDSYAHVCIECVSGNLKAGKDASSNFLLQYIPVLYTL